MELSMCNSMAATRGKTVLFLTDPSDCLAAEFALAIANKANCELSFFYAGVDSAQSADWCIAWVRDDDGKVQAWLDHLPTGQHHWLGTDAEKAMQHAARIISEWEKLEALAASLAVQ